MAVFFLLLQFFKVDGRHLTQARIASVRVVPSLNPVKYLKPNFRLGLPFASCNQLTHQRGKEALNHGVVISITHRSHERAHIHLLSPVAKCNAGVLAALIAVVDHRARALGLRSSPS